jgi:hypothetical protein
MCICTGNILCHWTAIEDGAAYLHMHPMRIQSLSVLLLSANTSMADTEDDGNGDAPTEKAIKDGPLERCRTVF